jgi:hypothetical protein
MKRHTVYRDCKLDPVGLQLVNQALAGGTRSPSSGKLSEADAATK